MNRETWDCWRDATGLRRQKLLTQIVEEHEGLIQRRAALFIARSNYYLKNLRQDIVQAARIGLMRAVSEWDPKRGAFSTCACWWMRHEMQQVVRDVTPITRPKSADLPRDKQDAAAVFFAKHGRDPEPEEIGVTEGAVDRAQKAQAKFVGLRVSVGEDGYEAMRQHDPALQCSEFVEGAEAAIDRERDLKALRAFLRKLSSSDRKAFWTGKREDLTAKAKAYVEKRRNVKATDR